MLLLFQTAKKKGLESRDKTSRNVPRFIIKGMGTFIGKNTLRTQLDSILASHRGNRTMSTMGIGRLSPHLSITPAVTKITRVISYKQICLKQNHATKSNVHKTNTQVL